MSTPDHLAHSVSIPIPIFTGITTEFKKWQLLIRDFAIQLDLEDFLLQDTRHPVAPGDIRNVNAVIFRLLAKPAFPLETATGNQIKFYELRIRAFQEERSRITALRNKIVGSISPDIYLQLFRTDFDRLNAGPDSLYYVLDIKFRLESAADIASQASSVLRGIENGNFEEFIARQKTYIKRCSEGGLPLTDLQQVDQLFTALNKQREINIKSIKEFFYDAYPERDQQACGPQTCAPSEVD